MTKGWRPFLTLLLPLSVAWSGCRSKIAVDSANGTCTTSPDSKDCPHAVDPAQVSQVDEKNPEAKSGNSDPVTTPDEPDPVTKASNPDPATVVTTAPPALADQSAQFFVETVAISPLSFANSGGFASSCSVAPALPAGLTVSLNAGTCRISGTPTAVQALATYTITATGANDTSGTAAVVISVIAAAAPALADLPVQTYVETVISVAFVNFVNSGYPAVSCSVSPPLPAGLAISNTASTCRLYGIPTALQALTTHTVTATAADGSTDTATVDISISAPVPPALANQSTQTYATTVAITPLSFTNTGAAATSCWINPALPTGLTIATNASTCRITGTPTTTQTLTTHTVTSIAADGSQDTATVDITVNTAVPPALANQSAQSYVTTVAIAPLSFTNTGAAATGCSILPALPTGLTIATNASTCRITGTPTANQSLTTHTVTSTAADGSTDTATVDITVNTAVPPALADQSAQTYVTTVAISPLSFTNTGAAAISCSILPALPTGLTITINASTCRIVGTPTATQALTTHTVTSTAADGSTDTATVDITVNAAVPPALANQSAQTYVTTVAISPLSFTNTGAAATGCSILPALPTGLTIATNASTCRIAGTPTATQSLTTHTVTSTAADGSTDTATVDITVNAAVPPALANQSAQTYVTTVAIAALSFTNTGAAATGCSILPALPTGLTIATNASTCRITGTPTATQPLTTHTVTSTAADGSQDTATVDIAVNAAVPPALADQSAQTYSLNVAIGSLSFTNTGAAATSCSILPALPTGLAIAANASTCQITGTPTTTQALTTHTVTATASDGSQDTATVDITVSVAACVWTGATSTSWTTASNWTTCSGTIPTMSENVRIPSGPANQPVISDTRGVLAISSGSGGGTITVSAGAALYISGDIDSSIKLMGNPDTCTTCIVDTVNALSVNAPLLELGQGITVLGGIYLNAGAEFKTNTGAFASNTWPTMKTYGIFTFTNSHVNIYGLKFDSTSGVALALNSAYLDRLDNVAFNGFYSNGVRGISFDCPSVLTDSNWDNLEFNFYAEANVEVYSSCGDNVSITGTGIGFGAGMEIDPNNQINWPAGTNSFNCTWVGGTSSWTTPGNWTGCTNGRGNYPDAFDSVIIPAVGLTPTVTGQQAVKTVKTGTNNAIVVSSGAKLTILGDIDGSLELRGATAACTDCLVDIIGTFAVTDNAQLKLGKGVQLELDINVGLVVTGTFKTTGGATSSEWPVLRGRTTAFNGLDFIRFGGSQTTIVDIDGLSIQEACGNVGLRLWGISGEPIDVVKLDNLMIQGCRGIVVQKCSGLTLTDASWDNIQFVSAPSGGNYNFDISDSSCSSFGTINLTGSGIGYSSAYELDPYGIVNWN